MLNQQQNSKNRTRVLRTTLFTATALLIMLQIFSGLSIAQTPESLFTPEEQAWIQGHKPIRVAPDPDYAPIESFESGKFRGISIDYLEKVHQLYGLEFTLVRYTTWSEVLLAAERGDVQMLSAAVMTPSRSVYLDFTAPYLTMPNQFFVRKGAPILGGIDNLRGKRIGVIDGYSSEDYLRLVYPEIKLIEVRDIKEGLTRLSLGELDAFAGDSGQVSYYTDYYKITNIVLDSSVQIDFPLKLSLAVSKKDPMLLSIMSKVVKDFPAHELSTIKSKWMNYKIVDLVDEQRFRNILIVTLSLWIGLIFAVLAWNRMLSSTVKAQTKQLRELIDFIPYPVFAKDHRRHFVIVNRAYADFFGLSPEQIEGMKDSDVYTRVEKGPQSRLGAFEERVLDDGAQVHIKEHKLIDAQGDEHIYDTRKVPFPILHQSQKGLLGISVDITELKKKENERIAGLSRLVSNVAHQLNTPLGNVISSFSFMTYQYEKAKQRAEHPENAGKIAVYEEFLETVEEADRVIAKSLSRLVNIVNAFKSLSISAENLDLETFSVKASMADIVSRMTTPITVNYQIDIDDDILVTTYKPIVMQIVQQIISNAVQHGFKDNVDQTPLIQFSWRQEGDLATLTICDNGVGIPEHQLIHVFDPLYSSAQYFGHLGLGLSIASNMAQQLLEGGIAIRNREEGGVCVDFKFKCR